MDKILYYTTKYGNYYVTRSSLDAHKRHTKCSEGKQKRILDLERNRNSQFTEGIRVIQTDSYVTIETQQMT